MKIIRVIFSDKGILGTTVLLLMYAAFLAMSAIGLEAQDQQLVYAPMVMEDFSALPSYVYAALSGNAPSAAGECQGWAIFIGSIVTPFVAAIMLAIKASLPAVDEDYIVTYAS